MKKFLVTLIATAFAASFSMAQVGSPVDAGLTPRTPTIDVNTNFNNNNLETGSVVITANTNVVVGWEDDGACSGDIDYWGVAWAMYSSSGVFLTTPTLVTNYTGSNSITSPYDSAFRDDGTMGPSHVMWGAKVKANLFGNGFGAGGNGDAALENPDPNDRVCFTYGIGFEIPRLFTTMNDEGGAGLGNFPAVQLLNSDGSKAANVLSGATEADAEPAGSIRLGDWEYLSNGNIVIAGESRQVADRALTGQSGGNVVTYTIVNPAGGVVRAYAAATSETNAAGQEMWHGVAVTANGFALRFNQGGTKIRLFDNNGNPQGPNIDLAAVTGHPEAGGGGRGDGTGFSGNGKDAYVYATASAVGPWVTVLNANGTVRYSRQLTDPGVLGTGGGSDRLGAGIAEDGRVVVAFQAQNSDPANLIGGLPQARLFDPSGNAIGPVFYVSERETPANALASNGGDGRPRVAFRGDTIAVMWGSLNSPATANIVLAMRIFDVAPYAPQVGSPADAGLTPRTPTIDVNTNFNNNNLETGSVVITANTNVVVGWEDDGACSGDIDYWGVAWAMYSSSGVFLTTPTLVTNYTGSNSITSPYDSAFRDDGTMGPSHVMWGAKVKANLFGNGFGAGGNGDAALENPDPNDRVCFTYGIGFEIPRLFTTMNDEGGAGLGNFPAVQLLNSDGSKAANVLSGATEADAEPAGSIRLGDWEYLSNGNIVIAGESRQVADRALTGQSGGNVVTYTIVNPAGGVVRAYAAATSETNAAGQEMWHGVAVTANGFALRFNQGGTKIRLFDNNGNPQGPNIDLAAVTGHPEAGGGGRGDGTGFSGNGKDAYVYATASAVGPWVTVLNANGTVRYSRQLTDPGVLGTGGGSDRLGAGIDENGRVVVAFQAQNSDTNNTIGGLPQARLFDPCGNPIGPVFYVSERETPANALASNGGDGRPRVALRGNTIAVMWGSLNSPATANIVLALRVFDVAPYTLPSLSISQSGANVIICWPASFGNLTLQSSPTISPSAWTAVSPQPAIVTTGGQNCMTVPIGAGNLFFRVAVCQ